MLIRLLRTHLRPYYGLLACVLVLEFAQVMASLYLPTLNADIINRGVATGDTGYIWRTGGLMLAVSAAQGACTMLATYLAARSAMGLGRDLRAKIFHRVGSFSEREVSGFGAGSLITRNTNDVQQIQMLVLMGCTMLVMAPIMAVGGIIMAVTRAPGLAWLVAVSVPVLLAIVGLIVRRMVPLFRSYQDRLDGINRVLREQLTGIRVIRAFVRERAEAERFAGVNHDMAWVGERVGRLFIILFPLVTLVLDVTVVGVIWYGGHRVGSGDVEVGTLIAFMAYLMQILMGIVMASFMTMMIPRATVCAERISEVLAVDPSLTVAESATTSFPEPGAVELRDVTFSYPDAEAAVLTGVSFRVAPGSTTAIVGSTGSGKSTLVALLARLVASAWSNALVWHLAARSKADLQLSVLDRLRRVPLGFFQRVDGGRLGSLVTGDVPMIDFQNVPQQLMGSVIQPVYALVVLTVVDWRLALAALAGVPVFLVLTVRSDRIYRRVFAELHRARQEATAVMLEQARGAAVLRSNPGSAMAARYEAAVRRLADASTAMSVRATPATALGSVAVESGQVILIAVGSALLAAGSVSPAVLLIFLLMSLALYQPIQELDALAGYRRNQQQIAARVGEVWDAPTLTEPTAPLAPKGSTVELRDVVFGYGKGAKAEDTEKTLRGVSLRADAGRVTALVGASGSGKSTIASLVSRLWDVDAGSVLIGGADARDIGSAGVLRAVTTVFQDVYLFDDTVRLNLTLGRPAATDGEIQEALRAAQCDDVVAALPDGLDTVLADGGSDLSGGQRQRLAIARALLKDSPVLILDEAVAAVDPATEDRIQAALSTLAAGRTVLVIAHRLATVQHAHRIVVVDDGAIAGIGTHEELLRDCPEYRRLAEAQGIGPVDSPGSA